MLNITNLHYLDFGPINLQIKACEIIGLSGASGAGKSRLLRALADLDEHAGEIRLDETPQQAISAHAWRKKVGLLCADTHWWFDTVAEHFCEWPERQLEALGFSQNIANWSIARLSSGEKQRLGLLRLLQNTPDVLLLDEPTANLDSHNTGLFETFVNDYLSASSACAIWVSHDIEQLGRICTRRYEIKQGALHAC
ncbi:MAG TPA: ATP-binding cassette domain-containing protein [Gammaproteobacteria bacterium]|nr:ATP-binding cassette domain-containing protein [Gammaproteobacteria bacterium]